MLNMTRQILVVSALLLAASVLPANAQQLLPEYNGEQLFQRFCASCHGTEARGDGPVAPHLNMQVPDLTQLSKRAGGSFPAERVREIIDGRAVLPAHGTRPMPVWGYELEAQIPPEEPGREIAQDLIDRLVEYLHSIQR
jgi:mono/diheme cytochrome c family protein